MQVTNQLGITMGIHCYNFCSEADAIHAALSKRIPTVRVFFSKTYYMAKSS